MRLIAAVSQGAPPPFPTGWSSLIRHDFSGARSSVDLGGVSLSCSCGPLWLQGVACAHRSALCLVVLAEDRVLAMPGTLHTALGLLVPGLYLATPCRPQQPCMSSSSNINDPELESCPEEQIAIIWVFQTSRRACMCLETERRRHMGFVLAFSVLG